MALLIVGCSPKTIIKNDNYIGKSFLDKDLIILPIIYDSLQILNWDDVVDDFEVDSATANAFLLDTLQKSLIEYSKFNKRNMNVYDVSSLDNWNKVFKDSSNYFSINQKINDDLDCTFNIPNEKIFGSKNFEKCFVLIINRILIARNIDRQTWQYYSPGQTISTPGGDFQTAGTWNTGWSPENLGARVEFIIWDYKENDFVKCGTTTSKLDFLFGMSTSTWIFLFKNLTLDLFKDTPFEISPAIYHIK